MASSSKRGSDDKNNPFSFKSFVTKKENVQSDEISESAKTSSNPFSFKIFVKSEIKPGVGTKLPDFEDALESSDRATQHTVDFITEDNASKLDRNDQTVQLDELLQELQNSGKTTFLNGEPNETRQGFKHKHVKTKSDLFESDSDSSYDSFEDSVKKEQSFVPEAAPRNHHLPSIDSSDSDDFTPPSNSFQATVLQDADNVPLQGAILENLHGLNKSELIRNIEKLREENKSLMCQLKASEESARASLARIAEQEKELERVRREDSKETAALEKVIQQVEANLETSTKRALESEKSAKQLKQELKSLQTVVTSLRAENEQLKSRGHGHPGASGDQLKFVSDQLLAAANNAEHSLKQLLGGVDSLKLMSQTLLSMDKFQELPGNHDNR